MDRRAFMQRCFGGVVAAAIAPPSISADELIMAYYSLADQYKENATWLVHKYEDK